jgi:hypothetical protein
MDNVVTFPGAGARQCTDTAVALGATSGAPSLRLLLPDASDREWSVPVEIDTRRGAETVTRVQNVYARAVDASTAKTRALASVAGEFLSAPGRDWLPALRAGTPVPYKPHPRVA